MLSIAVNLVPVWLVLFGVGDSGLNSAVKLVAVAETGVIEQGRYLLDEMLLAPTGNKYSEVEEFVALTIGPFTKEELEGVPVTAAIAVFEMVSRLVLVVLITPELKSAVCVIVKGTFKVISPAPVFCMEILSRLCVPYTSGEVVTM